MHLLVARNIFRRIYRYGTMPCRGNEGWRCGGLMAIRAGGRNKAMAAAAAFVEGIDNQKVLVNDLARAPDSRF